MSGSGRRDREIVRLRPVSHSTAAWRKRLRLSGRDHRLVQPPRAGLATVEHHGHSSFCVEALERRSGALASPRSSTPTRAASSPAKPSPACSRGRHRRSAWTARAAGSTTSSSSGSGVRSNTSTSTFMHMSRSAKPDQDRALLWFYNCRRPHSSLGAQTPDQVYFHRPPEALAA